VSLPRVLILSNEPVLPVGHADRASEIDVIETVDEVHKVLPPEQFIVQRFAYARNPRLLLTKLAEWKPDVVFNLFEGEADRTETEIYNAAILEWTGIPFTGSGSFAQALGRDKIRTKYLLQGAGVETAPFQVIHSRPAGDWPHAWPAIVKPACQDASVGIDQASVVTSQAELERRVDHVFERFGGPALVERFLAGRELHVHLIEDPDDGRLMVTPAAEVVFDSSPGNALWPVYSYAAKWDEGSDEYKASRLESPVVLPPGLNERVEKACLAAYRQVGLHDYGRVDLRVVGDEPSVIEVNPNPHINSLVFVNALKAMGWDFPKFVQGLVRLAKKRAT
jgi:D-alanine-D-alanine ligase